MLWLAGSGIAAGVIFLIITAPHVSDDPYWLVRAGALAFVMSLVMHALYDLGNRIAYMTARGAILAFMVASSAAAASGLLVFGETYGLDWSDVAPIPALIFACIERAIAIVTIIKLGHRVN